MTVDGRGRDAAEELASWTPSATPGDAKVRARRRTTNRRLFAAGVATMAAGVLAVGLASRGDDQPVIVAASPTTTSMPPTSTTSRPTSGGATSACGAGWGDAVVFLEVGATEEQIQSVGEMLRADDRVVDIAYLDDDDSYAVYVRMFANDSDLPAAMAPGELPTSYDVTLRDADDAAAFEADWDDKPDVFRAGPARCVPDATTVGQAVGDLTFDVTVTSRCSDYVRGPRSAMEPCPAPVLTTDDGIYVSVRRAGDPPSASLVGLGEGQAFPDGSYVADTRVMLTDWGCSASAEFAFTVTGTGERRSVVVGSINGRTVDREPVVGAPSKVSLTMLAAETSCTGGMTDGPVTPSVRVVADLTFGSGGDTVDRPSVSIVDPARGNSLVGGWDVGDEPSPVFLPPGSYGLVFSATGSSCPSGTYTGGTRLVVGDDGSLTLGDPSNPDDAVPVPVTVAAPPATPTLVPDDLEATVELRPAC